ncbi:CidA/LrgA family protein [Thioclava atlantica]|uniref:LrgA family protein n=1 Tax=Thioclava atlantica TaxID=1317124 RepID=A0A085TVS6_9RHOB|nr:CidA/LrgA family protein [Thioclava atlantica]KFE34823.1 LrgA family protein [Thioclava atlantica]
MIPALTLILLSQLAGETISRGLGLPLPGPVLGMIFLLVAMSVSERIQAIVRPVAQFILSHLSLLFVPAGVGIVAHLDALRAHGVGVLVALIGSTMLAIVVGAAAFVWVAKLTGSKADD